MFSLQRIYFWGFILSACLTNIFSVCENSGHKPAEYAAWLERHSAREGKTVSLTPKELVHADRYDVLAKYIYAYVRELGAHTSWGYEIYDAHLRVWGNYTEGFPQKNGIKQFIDSYHNVLDSIKEHGFDSALSCIPVRVDNYMALNGGHRIAAALLYHPDTPIKCSTITAMRGLMKPAHAEYFKNRTQFVEGGLADEYLDAMTLEYIKLKPNTFAVCLYHRARTKDDQVQELIKQYATIVYIKDIVLKSNGPRNFTKMLYDGEPWTSVPRYVRLHVDGCFDNTLREWPVRIFFIDTKHPKKVIECKQKIRDMFNIGKRSVHINDTHSETVRIAQSVLNQNSIDFLNNANLKKLQRFDHYFKRYQKWLDSVEGIDHNCFCIDSSAVMSAYGMRDCNDLDFLHLGHDELLPAIEGISSHNGWAHHYPMHKDEIIFNPAYHFYYKGCKFASLDIVRQMKITRNEEKDQRDVRLIRSMGH